MKNNTLTPELLDTMDVNWQGVNHLLVGQIYLFDQPELIVACVVGDGAAETGPLFRGYGWTPLFVEGHESALKYDRSDAFVRVTNDPSVGEIELST